VTLIDEPSEDGGRTEADAVDFGWKIHSALADWTGKVDAKASFALAAESAGLIATINLTAQGRAFSSLRHLWQVVGLWLAIGLLLFAAILAIVAVTPRLRRGRIDAEAATNFIYFGHLRHWQPDDLTQALLRRALLPTLATQCVNMSGIAWRKHRLVQSSLTLAAIAAGVLLALIATA